MKKATPNHCKEFKSKIKTAKKQKQIGKYGITGNSGLGIGGFLHIGMPYDSNGKVFVKWIYKRKLPDGQIEKMDSWKRVDKNKAKDKDIIRCTFCNKPAVRLDHLWPYYSEMNACENHTEEFKKCLNKKEFFKKEKQ